MKNLLQLASALCLFVQVANAQLYAPTGPIAGTTAGYYGINIASPAYTFDIAGWGQRIKQSGSTNYTTLRLENDAGRFLEIDYAGSAFPSSLLTGGTSGEAASISTVNSYPILFGTNNTFRMALSAAGNLGVGLPDPAHLIQVNSSNIPTIAIGKINANTNGKSRLYFFAGNGSAANGFNIDYMKTTSVDRLAFIDGGAVEVLSLLNGGQIGIGTTNPGTFKLAVEGKIGAREVVVTGTTPWPDYVFYDDYKLPSLETLERFIRQNKHLPGMPSAKDVEENGVKVGEMNALLLKKVEELTLYVIELKKELDQVKTRIK